MLWYLSLGALLATYLLGCYYIWTVPIKVNKVGGLHFLKVGKLQLSYCVVKRSK